MGTLYRPSVCRHSDTEHKHYDVVLTPVPKVPINPHEQLQKIAQKVGGRTAGDVITALLAAQGNGINLAIYGVDYIHTELLPLCQDCERDNTGAPSIGWDYVVNGTVSNLHVQPGGTLLARICHYGKRSCLDAS